MQISWWLAFAGGVLSFVSPCALPLYPSFLSYITGISLHELQETGSMRVKIVLLLHACAFLIGFSLIYYVLGFSASWMGSLFVQYQHLIRMVGAVLIFVMGLIMLGIFQPRMLMQERRFSFPKKKVHYLNSVLVGVIFAAGWTPCIGPIFSSILYANILDPGKTFFYITAYAFGFAVPFLMTTFFIGQMKWLSQYSAALQKIGGALLILLSILLYTNQMSMINIWLTRLLGRGGG
jgi:cytochrome c-type biogenesis protein